MSVVRTGQKRIVPLVIIMYVVSAFCETAMEPEEGEIMAFILMKCHNTCIDLAARVSMYDNIIGPLLNFRMMYRNSTTYQLCKYACDNISIR
jgi:hypothetical protein